MGGKGGKRKGRRLAVPSFGAVGMHMPSPTLSASGFVSGAELAPRMSYDVLVKVVSIDVVESVADVAALSNGVGRLVVSASVVAAQQVVDMICNLQVAAEVRSNIVLVVEDFRSMIAVGECEEERFRALVTTVEREKIVAIKEAGRWKSRVNGI